MGCGSRRSIGAIGWLGLLAVGLAACGSSTTNGNGNGNGGGDGGPGGDGDGGGGLVDAPYGGGDDSGLLSPDAACAADQSKAQQLPLGIYIMLDKSQSMDESVTGGTKWEAVTGALTSFISQPLTGVSVGLQYFGLNNNSCTAADYATPDVEIAPISAALTAAITNSIGSHGPGGRTPTSAALQGAIDHARTWETANPDHVTIVILATDGEPTECDTTLSHINAIAAAGVSGTPKILTFVIGVGNSLSNLNGIAQAGGTGQAFLVDTGADVTQQFLDALNAIRGAVLGCTYRIPAAADGGQADPTKINVQYTPGAGGGAQLIPQVANQAACPPTGFGWYYDNPAAPTQIILCDATCSVVQPDTSGEVDVLLGCKTGTID